MKVFGGNRLLDRGKPPVVMEPVQGTITIRKPGIPTVHLLDHDGCRTGNVLPVDGDSFNFDGARDRTPYYLIEYRDTAVK